MDTTRLAQLGREKIILTMLNYLSNVPLEYLNLNFNIIKDLPSEFTNLINLVHLEFSDCDLGYFPFAITKLTKLQLLYMDYGSFEYIPAEIGNLENLEELDLNANRLSSLPIEIGKLNNLKNLDISRNEFTTLPDGLFDLENLEELYAGENHISSINPKISRLKQLQLLDLGNGGSGLRYWAGHTSYDNEISELPLEINQLKKLKTLDMTGNPLPISPEILENIKDPSYILNAYFNEKPSNPKRKLRVFLCHSSNNKPQVRRMYKKLINDNIDAWLDEENLLPGQDWEFEITKAVPTQTQ